MGILKNIDLQKGLKFDGVNDWVSIPNFVLSTQFTSIFSLAILVNLQNLTGNKFLFITSNAPTGITGLYFYISATEMSVVLFNTGERGIYWQIPFSFIVNNTYHLAFSFNNGVCSMYVNGVLYTNSSNAVPFGGYQNTDNTTSTTIYSILAKGIGANNSQFTQGICKDFKLFNTAINQTDVTNLFNKTEIPAGCILDYRFDNKSGDVLINYVGGNNGSLVNYAPSDYAIGNTNSWLYEDGTAYDGIKGKIALINNN